MKPRIVTIDDMLLVGKRLTMSFANFKIVELWQSFSPRRNEILNTVNNDAISAVVYGVDHFRNFKPSNEFERWAAVEVTDLQAIPQGMESLIVPGGLYAVFEYKGLSTDSSVFRYIYSDWLPTSNYVLDNRPHFEVLGEKYRNNDPNSEEEIWVPVVRTGGEDRA